MVVSPADQVVARVWGELLYIVPLARPARRSRAALCLCACVKDSATYAIDVESRNTEAPPFLAQKFEPSDTPFFEHWTKLEVAAKLLERPVMELVKKTHVQTYFMKTS